MHLRNRHFYGGGTEIDAPSYVYYDKLAFMADFSIKKYPITSSSSQRTSSTVREDSQAQNFSPELLIHEQKDTKGFTELHDLTEEFIEAVKNYPCLYDDNAELRKYRSNVAWKALENKFAGKFTVGKMRSYWIQLIKKYKYFMNNYNSLVGNVENEHIFEKLYYVPVKVYEKSDACDIENVTITDETYEDETVAAEIEPDYSEVDPPEEFTEPEEEPPAKKSKNQTQKVVVIEESLPSTQNIESTPVPSYHNIQIPQTPQGEDEYDLFGKKVALQLREIALKNRTVARKGEIKVLQLLMELEESIEN